MSADLVRYNFYIPAPLKARVEAQAKQRGLTSSEMIRRLLEKAVDQLEAKDNHAAKAEQ